MQDFPYDYEIDIDIKAKKVDTVKLQKEIISLDSGITIQVESIGTYRNILTVFMKNELPTGEESILDGIVYNHDGLPLSNIEEFSQVPKIGGLKTLFDCFMLEATENEWKFTEYLIEENDLHLQGIMSEIENFNKDDMLYLVLTNNAGKTSLLDNEPIGEDQINLGAKAEYYDPLKGVQQIEFWNSSETELLEVRKIKSLSGNVLIMDSALASAKTTSDIAIPRISNYSSVKGSHGLSCGIKFKGSRSFDFVNQSGITKNLPINTKLKLILNTSATVGTRAITGNFLLRKK